MTYTEKIHVVFGVMTSLIGALALWGTLRPRSPGAWLWPIVAFFMGLGLFIPVEAHSRTYQDVGWMEAIFSFVPPHPATWWRDWLHYMPYPHAIQHKLAALLTMAIGVIEFARARGRLAGRGWGLALPALILGIALSLGIHGGTGGHLMHHSEQLQHQLLGVAFTVGAITLALVRTGHLHDRRWEGIWSAIVLLVGLNLTFAYRLTPAERGTEVHQHESTGPGMR
jgi:hypothetical protein